MRVISKVTSARDERSRRTNLVEHLVTLIEHEALDVAQAEVLVAHKGVQTTGSGDDDFCTLAQVELLLFNRAL